MEVEPFVYHTSLVFSSLDETRGDEGEYTCTVTVSAPQSPLYTPVTLMATRLLQVESKSGVVAMYLCHVDLLQHQ